MPGIVLPLYISLGLAGLAWADDPPSTEPATPSPRKARIVVGQDIWDFGQIWHGDKVEKEIELRNDGDAELVITRVRASCGCTAGSARKSRLAAGETTSVNVSFDSAHKQGRQDTQVNIFSNDPDRPQATIYVKGEVLREFTYEPMGGCFVRTLHRDAVATSKCTIRSNSADQQMKVELKSVDNPHFDVTVREVEAGKIYEVLCTGKPPFPVGRTVGFAKVSTGMKREPELVISLSVEVLDKVDLSPPGIFIDRDMIREVQERGVNLQYYGDRTDFKVLGVSSSNPIVKVSFEPAAPASADFQRLNPPPMMVAKLTVLPPIGKEMPADGVMITIQTNEPGYEEIPLMVTSDPGQWQRILNRKLGRKDGAH